jgi:hypothetical protein
LTNSATRSKTPQLFKLFPESKESRDTATSLT